MATAPAEWTPAPEAVTERTWKSPPSAYHLGRCSTGEQGRHRATDHGVAWKGATTMIDMRCPIHGRALTQTTRVSRMTWWLVDTTWANALGKAGRARRHAAKLERVESGNAKWGKDLKVGDLLTEGLVVKIGEPSRGRLRSVSLLRFARPGASRVSSGTGMPTWAGEGLMSLQLTRHFAIHPEEVVAVSIERTADELWSHAKLDELHDAYVAWCEAVTEHYRTEGRVALTLDEQRHYMGHDTETGSRYITEREYLAYIRDCHHERLDTVLLQAAAAVEPEVQA